MSGRQLQHVPALEDALADCVACGTQVGILLWRDGRPFVQECPACGAVIKAKRHADWPAGYAETDATGVIAATCCYCNGALLVDADGGTRAPRIRRETAPLPDTQNEDTTSDDDSLRAMFGEE